LIHEPVTQSPRDLKGSSSSLLSSPAHPTCDFFFFLCRAFFRGLLFCSSINLLISFFSFPSSVGVGFYSSETPFPIASPSSLPPPHFQNRFPLFSPFQNDRWRPAGCFFYLRTGFWTTPPVSETPPLDPVFNLSGITSLGPLVQSSSPRRSPRPIEFCTYCPSGFPPHFSINPTRRAYSSPLLSPDTYNHSSSGCFCYHSFFFPR